MKSDTKKIINTLFNSDQTRQKALYRIRFQEDEEKQKITIPNNLQMPKRENFILRIPSV